MTVVVIVIVIEQKEGIIEVGMMIVIMTHHLCQVRLFLKKN